MEKKNKNSIKKENKLNPNAEEFTFQNQNISNINNNLQTYVQTPNPLYLGYPIRTYFLLNNYDQGQNYYVSNHIQNYYDNNPITNNFPINSNIPQIKIYDKFTLKEEIKNILKNNFFFKNDIININKYLIVTFDNYSPNIFDKILLYALKEDLIDIHFKKIFKDENGNTYSINAFKTYVEYYSNFINPINPESYNFEICNQIPKFIKDLYGKITESYKFKIENEFYADCLVTGYIKNAVPIFIPDVLSKYIFKCYYDEKISIKEIEHMMNINININLKKRLAQLYSKSSDWRLPKYELLKLKLFSPGIILKNIDHKKETYFILCCFHNLEYALELMNQGFISDKIFLESISLNIYSTKSKSINKQDLIVFTHMLFMKSECFHGFDLKKKFKNYLYERLENINQKKLEKINQKRLEN